jgi:hypothetical protein
MFNFDVWVVFSSFFQSISLINSFLLKIQKITIKNTINLIYYACIIFYLTNYSIFLFLLKTIQHEFGFLYLFLMLFQQFFMPIFINIKNIFTFTN